MRQVLKSAAWVFAIVFIVVGGLVLKACSDTDSQHTEVTPVLESTAPEATGPAESEEETVVKTLPDSGGVKLVKER